MKNPITIAVANQKGGVAKTTTAINVGASLALADKKVLIIDFDPQESLSNFFGYYHSEHSIGTALYATINKQSINLADYIIHNEKNNVDILPAELNSMLKLEKDLNSVRSKETVMKRFIANSDLSVYDFIIIDCLASLNVMLDNALTASDYVVIPCQTHPLAFATLPNLFIQIDDIIAELNSNLKVLGIVPTMCERNNNSKLTVEMLNENYADIVFKTCIDKQSLVGYSAIKEKAVVLSNAKDNKVSAEYRALTTEILERL